MFVIITAGGIGSRMNLCIPKQFVEIGNKPILMHSISAFYSYSNNIQIIVTLPENEIIEWQKLVLKHAFDIKHTVVAGGKTRFHSIKNALKLVDNNSLVAIHDGVRPFVSTNLIENGFLTAEKNSSAIPMIPVKDSIRIMNKNYPSSIDRSKVFSIQTPQVFDSNKIIQAYKCPYSPKFTDDSTVYEKKFGKIYAYEGITENIKITNPIDLEIAQTIFKTLSNHPSFPYLLSEQNT